ncbi:MAG TPA: hypothetical protein VFJ58_23400 [Armatimonadota bacterium]|nr:hypothetical protein [Armatimonadota bacterium]
MSRSNSLSGFVTRFVLTAVLFVGAAAPCCAQGYGFQLPSFGAFGPIGPARVGNVSIYPFAQFNIRVPGASASDTGVLVAAEEVFGRSKGAYAFGGWYWSKYNSDPNHIDFYEGHAKYYFTRQIGIQAGVIGTTIQGGNVVDVFLLGSLDSHRYQPHTHYPWAIQAGAGPFIDPTGGETTKDITAFVSGDLTVWRGWSLDASYWYVRDRIADLNRIAIGFGHKI